MRQTVREESTIGLIKVIALNNYRNIICFYPYPVIRLFYKRMYSVFYCFCIFMVEMVSGCSSNSSVELYNFVAQKTHKKQIVMNCMSISETIRNTRSVKLRTSCAIRFPKEKLSFNF